MRIPTLEEILEISQGEIFLNLDKGFDYIGLVYSILKKWNMMDEVLFKGETEYENFDKKYNYIKDRISLCPLFV